VNADLHLLRANFEYFIFAVPALLGCGKFIHYFLTGSHTNICADEFSRAQVGKITKYYSDCQTKYQLLNQLQDNRRVFSTREYLVGGELFHRGKIMNKIVLIISPVA
jgi:hypothetical protein